MSKQFKRKAAKRVQHNLTVTLTQRAEPPRVQSFFADVAIVQAAPEMQHNVVA